MVGILRLKRTASYIHTTPYIFISKTIDGMEGKEAVKSIGKETENGKKQPKHRLP